MKRVLTCAAALLTAWTLLAPAITIAEAAPETEAVSQAEAASQAEAGWEQWVPAGEPAPAEPAPSGEAALSGEAGPADGWQQILVNPWNPLPEGFTVELKTLSNGLQVDARICDALNAMLSDCREAGLRPYVCSAYRAQAVQTRLYNNKIARLRAAGYGRESAVKEAGRWVAVPGTSEHQTGLALDIVASSYQVLNHEQEQTAEQKWLMEHCWEYGFILRYPVDKSEVTGIGYEPWHYRYVGRETALAVRDSGLCLEEYLSARRDGGADS